MTTSSLFASPRLVAWAIRIERAPVALWLACVFAALTPTWVTLARGLAAGQEHPFVLLPVALLLFVAWQHRTRLRPSPRLAWLALGIACALASTCGLFVLRAPVVNLFAVAALAASLAAFLPGAPARGSALPVLRVHGAVFDNTVVNRVAYKLACAGLVPVCGMVGVWKMVGLAGLG